MSEENKAEIKIDFVVNRDEAVQDLQKIKQAREDLGKAAVAASKSEAQNPPMMSGPMATYGLSPLASSGIAGGFAAQVAASATRAARLQAQSQARQMAQQQQRQHANRIMMSTPAGMDWGHITDSHEAPEAGIPGKSNDLKFQRFGAVARKWHRRMTALGSTSGLGELAGGLIGGAGGADLGAGIGTLIQGGIDKVAQGMRGMAGRQNISNNASLNSWQKQQILEEQMPVVGGLIRSMREFRQAMDGTTETLRANQERFANIGADRAAQQQVESQSNAFRGRVSEAQNRAAVAGGAAVAPQQRFDRLTAAGAEAYQQAQRLLPLQDAVAAAGREVQVARANEAAATRRRLADGDRNIRGIGDRQLSANKRLLDLQRQQRNYASGSPFDAHPALRAFTIGATFGLAAMPLSQHRHGLGYGYDHDRTADLDTTRRELAQISRDMAGAAREQLTRSHAEEAAGMTRVQAEQRQQGAIADLNRGRLANLEQCESHMASFAGRAGSMTRMDRRRGLRAAQMIQTRGIGHVPHSVIEQARAWNPGFVERESQRFGEMTPEAMAERASGRLPETERGSLRDIHGDIAMQQDQIRNDVLNAATLAAKSQVDLIVRAFAEFKTYMDLAVKAEHDARMRDQAVAHGNQR